MAAGNSPPSVNAFESGCNPAVMNCRGLGGVSPRVLADAWLSIAQWRTRGARSHGRSLAQALALGLLLAFASETGKRRLTVASSAPPL